MKHPAFRTFKTEKRRDKFPSDGCEFIHVITRTDLPLTYVGRTKEPLFDHLRAHLSDGTLVGENAGLFSISRLEECPSRQAGERERHWIAAFDTCNPSKGWNKYPMIGTRNARHHLVVLLEADDLAVLAALTKFDRLNMSDVTRRAIRHYAKALGVEPKPEKAA